MPNLSGYRNLQLLANIRNAITQDQVKEAIRKVGLDPSSKKAVAKYSLGMKQRLGIAQAIMEDPDMLILDEPFNGLDKEGVKEIRELIGELKKAGKTIMLTSHNSEDIKLLADDVWEMDGGRLERMDKAGAVWSRLEGMQLSQSIKKRLGVIVLVLISILEITSCAKTPKEKVVADKSEGLAKEEHPSQRDGYAQGSGDSKHWKETLDRSDGFVTLEADCDMNIPEIYNTPVYSYEMASLKKDWLSRLCGYFAKGDKLYEYPEMTKDELRKEKEKIANYEGRWATWSKGGQLTTYWEGMLKTMDELIEKAPEERAENKYIEANLGVPYQTEKDYFNEVSDYYYDTDDKIGLTARVDRGRECDPVIRVVDYDDKVGSTTKFVYSQGTFVDEIDLAELEFDNAESTEAYDEWLGRLREEADADVGLTQEEALKKVDEMLKDLSIKGFEVSGLRQGCRE